MSIGEQERRGFARIETSLECTVATDADLVSAKVSNLSRTGAGVLAPAGALSVGQSVSVMLERAQGEFSLSLSAQVVRTQPQGDEVLFGLRFEPPPPGVEETLLALLKALAESRGDGRRSHRRVQARIEVSCRSPDAFRAWLVDLSQGGLAVKCPRPVELGSQLKVQFGIDDHRGLVAVQGEVKRVSPLDDGRYLVGLQFEPPSEEHRQRVEKLLSVLLGLGPRQGMILDDDEEP